MSGTVARMTAGFEEAEAASVICDIEKVYDDIALAQDSWLAAAPCFRCPPDCGSCCDDFEPDILESEALFLAAWMLSEQRARALELASFSVLPPAPGGHGCPLRGRDTGGCCTVYSGRPLICRLFGYSGDRGKDGAARFRPCRFHSGVEKVTIGESELRARFGVLPALMGDFAVRVLNLLPDGVGNRRLLSEALPDALRKIEMLKRLSCSQLFAQGDEPNHEPDGGDSPLPTFPRAV